MQISLFVGIVAALAFLPSLAVRAADIHAAYASETGRSLIVIGKINPGDDEKFRRVAVGTIRSGKWVGIVKVFSQGGDVRAAMGIGEQVRSMRASTVAPSMMDRPPGLRVCLTDLGSGSITYNTQTGHGDRNCDCASACFLIWAAGVGRQGDVIGIHRPYFDPAMFKTLSSGSAEAMYEEVVAEQKRYLERMGIPPYFTDMLFAHSSHQMHYLTKQELQIFPPLPPAISELRLARCGERPPNGDSEGGLRHYHCTQALYEEASRRGNAEYLARYGR